MKLRAVVLSLSMLLLVAAPTTPASDWAFSGCFSLTGSTPCYDVYTHNGAHWICDRCGTTKRPNENKCRQLSAYELANGRWCS